MWNCRSAESRLLWLRSNVRLGLDGFILSLSSSSFYRRIRLDWIYDPSKLPESLVVRTNHWSSGLNRAALTASLTISYRKVFFGAVKPAYIRLRICYGEPAHLVELAPTQNCNLYARQSVNLTIGTACSSAPPLIFAANVTRRAAVNLMKNFYSQETTATGLNGPVEYEEQTARPLSSGY